MYPDSDTLTFITLTRFGNQEAQYEEPLGW